MSFATDLLSWYDANARTLPWRGETDPYRIWLSEIMLQQTQTQTVKGYYARFLDRFPDVFALADAPEEEVLKLWEGLGYYSRARNLHAAAKAVAAMGGAFPGDAAGLRQLPGIGPYAANAIASIAYGEPVPALDGNQARVLSRVLAWEMELRTPFDLLEPALKLIPKERPGDYNQALMDLGASICVPKSPRCGDCPVRAHCVACAEEAVEDFPRKSAPVPKVEQEWTIALALTRDGKLLVHRRPKGLLGGLYEFACVEGHPGEAELRKALSGQGFGSVEIVKALPDARHVFTHRVWRMRGWLVRCGEVPEGFTAVDAAALAALPFPSALRVYREIAGEVLPEA